MSATLRARTLARAQRWLLAVEDSAAGDASPANQSKGWNGVFTPSARPQLALAMWVLGGASLAPGFIMGLMGHLPIVVEISVALAAVHALVGALLRWTRLSTPVGLLPLAIVTPATFALIAHLTGGVESPAFRAMILIPIIGAVMAHGDLLIPSATGISTLCAGTALLLRSSIGLSGLTIWMVLLVISTAVSIFAALQYRRLIAAETGWLLARNEALARVATSERQLVLQGEQQREQLAAAFHQIESAHSELKRVHELAVSQEKLAAIGTLAAGIAHEINNPMSFVMSNVQLLLADLRGLQDLPAGLREHVDEALPETLDGIRRVNAIVADLRRFARSEPEGPATVYDLNEQIAFALRIVRTHFEDDQKLQVELGTIPHLHGWPGRIVQVVTNLVANAAQAIQEHGTVKISTFAEGEEVLVVVRDTGTGMSPTTLAHLFDPFFTTKPVGKGTGLGLSVSHGIVQAHGGHIEVQSELGRGSCFTVRLPRTLPVPAAPATPLPTTR